MRCRCSVSPTKVETLVAMASIQGDADRHELAGGERSSQGVFEMFQEDDLEELVVADEVGQRPAGLPTLLAVFASPAVSAGLIAALFQGAAEVLGETAEDDRSAPRDGLVRDLLFGQSAVGPARKRWRPTLDGWPPPGAVPLRADVTCVDTHSQSLPQGVEEQKLLAAILASPFPVVAKPLATARAGCVRRMVVRWSSSGPTMIRCAPHRGPGARPWWGVQRGLCCFSGPLPAGGLAVERCLKE